MAGGLDGELGGRRKEIQDPPDGVEKREKDDPRRPEYEGLSRATSITADMAPQRVPNKKPREVHKDEIDFAQDVAKKAVERKDQFIEKMPTLYELLGVVSDPKELEDYSYQTDLYDAVPKFTWAPVKREMGKYLPVIKREFKHQGGSFYMELTPARVDDKDHYPGEKEELIEMELVQMAFERGMPMLGGYYGVKFSLYEIRKRLKEKGHTFSIIEIKRGLYIMSGAILEVRINTGKGESLVREALFSSLGLRTWDDWKDLGRTSECFVKFNSLHVEALRNQKWRLVNESKIMLLEGPLSRWIYKRMAREWVRSEFNKPVLWRLSSIIRDSGIGETNHRKARMKIESAFNDLKKNNHIFSWSSSEELGGQKGTKILDVVYDIRPSLSFSKEMKRLNQLKRDSRNLELPPS